MQRDIKGFNRRKTRTALTVPEDLDNVLKRLAKLSKRPKSALIVEILSDAKPQLELLIKTIEKLEKQKEFDFSEYFNESLALVGDSLQKLRDDK